LLLHPNSKAPDGGTPLRSAVISASNHVQDHPDLYNNPHSLLDRIEVVKLLLERDADPHAKSTKTAAAFSGKSALEIVQGDDYKHLEIKQLLLDHVEAKRTLEPPKSSSESLATLTAAGVAAISVGLYLYSNYSAYRREEETSAGYFGKMFS